MPRVRSPSEVLRKGLLYCRVFSSKRSTAAKTKEFRKHYGASPLDLCDMWYDLTVTDITAAKLNTKDNSDKGFKMFLIAHHFLWVYPKNAKVLGSRFDICEKYASGDHLWRWIKKIAALKAKKIVWPAHFNSQQTETFAVTVDGTDFRIWETKHPTLPKDKKIYSKKFNHGAVKYEIVLSVYQSKCVMISRQFKGATHDIEMTRVEGGLKTKMNATPGKLAIADRGYVTDKIDERFYSTPNGLDPPELQNFKSRGRLRHETFNGRLKKYGSLEQTFKHGIKKHQYALEAICVTVQYQMDNGSALYAV